MDMYEYMTSRVGYRLIKSESMKEEPTIWEDKRHPKVIKISDEEKEEKEADK